jgi:hypothetical protein
MSGPVEVMQASSYLARSCAFTPIPRFFAGSLADLAFPRRCRGHKGFAAGKKF